MNKVIERFSHSASSCNCCSAMFFKLTKFKASPDECRLIHLKDTYAY